MSQRYFFGNAVDELHILATLHRLRSDHFDIVVVSFPLLRLLSIVQQVPDCRFSLALALVLLNAPLLLELALDKAVLIFLSHEQRSLLLSRLLEVPPPSLLIFGLRLPIELRHRAFIEKDLPLVFNLAMLLLPGAQACEAPFLFEKSDDVLLRAALLQHWGLLHLLEQGPSLSDGRVIRRLQVVGTQRLQSERLWSLPCASRATPFAWT